MPQFIVSSGEYEVRITRRTARRAAKDAIGMLKDTSDDVHLGFLVGVCGVNTENYIYLSTIVLMEENGIKFRLLGEECETFGPKEAY